MYGFEKKNIVPNRKNNFNITNICSGMWYECKKKKTDINGNLCSYVKECVCVNIYTCKQKLVIRDKSREKLCRIHFFFQIECYIFVTRKRTQLLVLYSIHMVSRPYICTYIQVIWSSCNTNKNRLKMPSPFMF